MLSTDTKTIIHKWINVLQAIAGGINLIVLPVQDALPKWVVASLLLGFGVMNLVVSAVRNEFDQ